MVTAIFVKAGCLRSVYVQNRKRVGRHLRFGFLRYNSDAEAECAIRKFNGLKLEGAFLTVKKAKYQAYGGCGENYVPAQFKQKYVVQGKVWRPKRKKEDLEAKPDVDEPNTNSMYNMAEEEKVWIERCAVATLYNVTSPEAVQEGLRMQGLVNLKIKLLGARDVLLEFVSKDEMVFTLSEASSVLDENFEWYNPCSAYTVGQSNLAWLRVRKIPLGMWNTSFFCTVANLFGKYVCVDSITSRKDRLDFARVLVDTTQPLIDQQYLDVNFDGKVCQVLVEKELSVYHDWTGLRQTQKPKALSSTDSEAEAHEGDDVEVENWVSENTPAGSRVAVATGSGLEPETVDLGGATALMRELIEAGYTSTELIRWLHCTAIFGGNGAPKEERFPCDSEQHLLSAKIRKNLNEDGEIFGPQKDHPEKKGGGVSHERQKQMWAFPKPTCVGVGAEQKQNQSLGEKGGDSSNTQQKATVSGPVTKIGWILQNPLCGFRGSLCELKGLARLRVSLLMGKHIAIGDGVKEEFTRSMGDYEEDGPGHEGVRVGLGKVPEDTKKSVIDDIETANENYADIEEALEIRVYQKKNKKRGGSVSEAATSHRESKPRAKRGRPKGSKNRSKVQTELGAICSGDEIGEETVASWASNVWRVGKEVGVVFRGNEDLALARLQDQVRINHPDLQ
ncbi:uncharacterized protein LOC130737999 [Lotus japonicus]|uniref:uncharacterized protein LOC130737999 n=1 Tax=Lotus japonicus TaxID=34305 RepID=UPI00258435C4|nr:uncharacterized protein LOC130737999 [Lotus japonicus]XP_057445856.1 uncharacterized protein LOC130737999 [Lotus japonicus]XP_057445857.1 uncharacterized protein LOC130737999 [Lotus japonicus]XP_057445858.1 uncharacterized protein LOC130737999 [Lotus japonicus]XP_057445859.1 uncharacterized protein LOC130737999 [Lotus japonicus]XP_057445860.1 uncharacterized protein LOC130737999 [Lotus japonicus]XP_057445861.1 uncharacterized protein LOC130737999 [Lotus japonicus]